MAGLLLRLLRVPPEPAAPDGTADSILVFRAGRNYYRWRMAMWGLAQFGVFVMLAMALGVLIASEAKMPPVGRTIWRVAGMCSVVIWAVQLAFTYLLQRLNYEQRWYIVTDRSLRIRSGIWDVQELTMTFANIQDLRIVRDPLQLALGLSDLAVSSAGGGSVGHAAHASSSSHTAKFAGVDNADALRDLIAERLRRYRDAGLGDAEPGPAMVSAEDAVAEVLAEARALRGAVERG